MNEPRAHASAFGLTVAEYFRDQGRMYCSSSIFRFRKPASVGFSAHSLAVGYQPTLATDMGALQGGSLRPAGLDHVGPGDLRARRRLHRPRAGDDVRAS